MGVLTVLCAKKAFVIFTEKKNSSLANFFIPNRGLSKCEYRRILCSLFTSHQPPDVWSRQPVE